MKARMVGGWSGRDMRLQGPEEEGRWMAIRGTCSLQAGIRNITN